MVGFYAMAFGIVGFCYAVSAAMILGGGEVPIKLVIILLLMGTVVLWSVVPRWDRFTAPGPRLIEQEHPKLFRVLREVAHATGRPLPSEVYLVDDVNAFVTSRGGLMGFGSRPVMGLGLPLLQCLTVDEMRAVIAHEFGHYVGGDTALGPWLYKTRSALVRTLENLAATGSLLVFPFTWYLRFFMWVSHAVSRQQEFLADQVGVRVAGAPAMARSLRKVAGVAPAFGQYWRDEVVPVLVRGHRPPVAAGFVQYLLVPEIASLVNQIVVKAHHHESRPYDTHPPLPERLRAIGEPEVRAEALTALEDPAITLLGDIDATESALVRRLLRDDVDDPQPIAWGSVGEAVYPALWDDFTRREPFMAQLSLSKLPEFLRQPEALAGAGLHTPVPSDPEERRALVRYIAGTVVGRTLRAAGFLVENSPGRPLHLVREGERESLEGLVNEAAALKPEVWRARILALNVPQPLFEQSPLLPRAH